MVDKLPNRPGVYLFKGKKGQILYIGKAVNIKKRVKDHLSFKDKSYKQKHLIEKTDSVSFMEVDSEIEALLLEANLIKKYRPDYNSQLKDGKDYLYIKITKDGFPRVLTARQRDLNNVDTYYGPFPSAFKVRATLKTLRKIFPFSTCKPPSGRGLKSQKKPCLAFHLGLCPGVCASKINKLDYKKNISLLKLILSGKKSTLVHQTEKQINFLSKTRQYERAAVLQKQLNALKYITKPIRNTDEYLNEDITSIRKRELLQLKILASLDKIPRRIECYDVSNIFGQQAVGSMVVFLDGEPAKEEYRRFKIKKVFGINDTGMLREVLERRFAHDWHLPDLLVVDGGKGQLNLAKDVLRQLNLNIRVISLAKRLEEIYLDNERNSVILPRTSDELKLVQRLRDEAHRFAITYHRTVRRREFLPTP